MSNKSRRNQPRPSGSRPQPKVGRPTREAPTTPATGWRRKLEIKTGPLLVMMHSMPRWILPVALAALLFFGLLLSGTWAWLGSLCLLVISVFLGWLLALSWPMLSNGSRTLRLVVVVAVFGIAVLKLFGKF